MKHASSICNYKLKKLLSIKINRLIDKQFEVLGDSLADCLLYIEITKVNKYKKKFYTQYIRQLTDRYAQQFDKELIQQKNCMQSKIKEIIVFMLNDLEKYEQPLSGFDSVTPFPQDTFRYKI